MKDPLIDRLVGDRFQIRSRIGEGGMSVVYLARDTKEGGEAAVKVLHRHLLDSEDFVARFEQEARTASRLRHEAAVRIYDSGVDDGLPSRRSGPRPRSTTRASTTASRTSRWSTAEAAA